MIDLLKARKFVWHRVHVRQDFTSGSGWICCSQQGTPELDGKVAETDKAPLPPESQAPPEPALLSAGLKGATVKGQGSFRCARMLAE